MSKWGFLLIVLVAFLWAICFPLIEIGLSSSSPFLFGALRALIAGVGLILPSIFFSPSLRLSKRLWLFIFGAGVTYTFLGFGGMFLSGGRVGPGLATVLANTQPLIAAVLAHFYLSENLGGRQIFGLLIGFFGIIFIAIPEIIDPNSIGALTGIGFVLVGAIGTASGNVFLKKLAGKVDPLVATGIQFLVGAAFLFSASFITESPSPIHWDKTFLFSLFTLGLVGTALVTYLWYLLLQRVPLTQLNVFTFLTPGFGFLLGFLFFSERLTINQVGGIGLILVGIFLVNKR